MCDVRLLEDININNKILADWGKAISFCEGQGSPDKKTAVQMRTHLFAGDFPVTIYLAITNSQLKLRFLQYRNVVFFVWLTNCTRKN